MAQSNIVKGALISYVSIFLNIAISLFYTPWMIRKIGVADYGIYSLVISFISYFIMDFGLSKAITRFISNYRASDNPQMISNMLGITAKVYLILDTIILVVLVVISFFLSDLFHKLTGPELATLKVLYAIAATFSVLSFLFRPFDGAMMAYELFVANKSIDMIQKVGSVLLICVALYFNGGVVMLVLIMGFTGFLTSLTKYLYFQYKAKIKINYRYYDKTEVKSMCTFSGWAFGRGLAQRMRLTMIPSVLGMLSNTTEVSIFALGITIEAMVFTLSSAINGLFMPKISRMSHGGNRQAINDLMIRVGRIELFIISLIFSGFFIFGSAFLNLWVGKTFAPTYYVVLFLIMPNLIIFTEDTAENLVFVENKVKFTTIIILICSAIGLVGSACVASRYGAVGCAFCSCLALLMDTTIVNIFYQKGMKLNIISFFKKCFGRPFPIYCILAILGYFIISKITTITWPILIGSIAVYTTLYGLSAYILTFNTYERNLLKQILNIKSFK